MRRATLPCWCVVLWLFTAALGWARTPAAVPEKFTDLRPTVILISIDGYRWDYPDKYPSPNLNALIRGGVRAEMIPAFPTKTFPNHYTLVTGLYPGNHGIVANNMWDDELQARFTMSNRAAVTDARWWGGEPIWVTARKQGQKAAAMFWPGSEAPIGGALPDYWMPFQDDFPHRDRIAWILQQFDRPAAERPTFTTLYFSDVDHAGHDYGPETDEVRQAVLRVDAAVGELINGLRARGIFEQVNLIVVADHGMVSVSRGTIFLDDYVDPATVQVVDWSPVLAIKAKDGNHEALLQKLKQAPHLTMYRKPELPARFHYSQHPRIAPLIGLADPGWNITTRKRAAERTRQERGTHGYDPALRDMHAVFIAHGPNFKRGAKLKPFENVHVYPAMAKILGLQPAKNDGDVKVLEKAMAARRIIVVGVDPPDPEECAYEPLPANLSFKTAAVLRGVIQDPSGAPFSNIAIELREPGRGGKTLARVTSDEDGGFILAPVAAGEYRLVAMMSRGFAQPEKAKCEGESCALRLRLRLNPTHQRFSHCPVQ